MNRISLTIILVALCLTSGFSQSKLIKHGRSLKTTGPVIESLLDPELKPFYHGVASGDPLSDGFIIWTRVTPETEGQIEGTWEVANDAEMINVVASGNFTTDVTKDYTVKIDVTGLNAETTYYYHFETEGIYSLTGRSRTAPENASDNLKFAVVSCSNYQGGYFNAYSEIAERNDLDAVIHLGDYIYEYKTVGYELGSGGYGNTDFIEESGRVLEPEHEIVELADYRTRYSLYRLDTNLRKAHQQHPFIAVWDDHESANDAYKDGAQNHDPNQVYREGSMTEGDWEARKAAAKKAYFEWMPLRESAEEDIYRTINYGSLADLFMIDTRLEGRTEQPADLDDPKLSDPAHTMLGEQQKAWLIEALKNSTSKWKVVGNQVIFSPLNVGFAAGFDDGSPDVTNIDSIKAVESIFLDIWDGYPLERSEIIDSIDGIDNIIFLTGDFHSTFAFDVTDEPVVYPNAQAFNLPTPSPQYDPVSGTGSKAVEFAVPSISSANFDENVGVQAAALFEGSMNGNIPVGPPLGSVNYNPHMKFVDLDRHGYFILDLKADSAQADWFFINTILEPTPGESGAEGRMVTRTGENHLVAATNGAIPKPVQQAPAPSTPYGKITSFDTGGSTDITVLGLYPNPVKDHCVIQFYVKNPNGVQIMLHNDQGQLIETVLNDHLTTGLYTVEYYPQSVKAGVYFVKLVTDGTTTSKKILITE